MDNRHNLFNNILELLPPLISKKSELFALLYQYDIGDIKTPNSSDTKDYVSYFINSKKIEGLSLKSLKNYSLYLRQLTKFTSGSIIYLSTNDIRAFLTYLNIDRNLKESSIQTVINIFRSFFSWLVVEEIIAKNPMSRIKSPKIDKKHNRVALTLEQLEKIRDACSSYRQKAIIEFFSSSGCRLSEVAEIKINDINFQSRSVRVLGKGGKKRAVFFSVRAKLMIHEYLSTRKGKSEYLFSSLNYPYENISGRSIEIIVKNIGLKSGLSLNVYPHLLRHTFATNAINSGMEITSIQHLLGHEDVGTTQIYAQIDKNIIWQEYNKLSL